MLHTYGLVWDSYRLYLWSIIGFIIYHAHLKLKIQLMQNAATYSLGMETPCWLKVTEVRRLQRLRSSLTFPSFKYLLKHVLPDRYLVLRELSLRGMNADQQSHVKGIKLGCFASFTLSSSSPGWVTSSGGILQQPIRALFPLLPPDEPEMMEQEGCPAHVLTSSPL